MPNRIFIDTLFVIALINRRDQYHQQALDLAEQFEGHPLLVTDAVLLEIGNALARSYKQEAVEIIAQFLAAEEVDVVHLKGLVGVGLPRPSPVPAARTTTAPRRGQPPRLHDAANLTCLRVTRIMHV